MYDTVVTVFNFHEKTGKWYTTVFDGVSLYETESTNATQNNGNVNASAVEAIIRVDQSRAASTMVYESNRIVDNAGNVISTADGIALCYKEPETRKVKRHIGSKAFSGLNNPDGYFTFRPEMDFFVIGDYSANVPILDDAYEEGLYHAMNHAQDGVFMVVSAAFYGLLPHFEIGGR